MMWLLIILSVILCFVSGEISKHTEGTTNVAENNTSLPESDKSKNEEKLSYLYPSTPPYKEEPPSTNGQESTNLDSVALEFLKHDHSCDNAIFDDECNQLCIQEHLIPLCKIDVQSCLCLKKGRTHYIKVFVFDARGRINSGTESKGTVEKSTENNSDGQKGQNLDNVTSEQNSVNERRDEIQEKSDRRNKSKEERGNNEDLKANSQEHEVTALQVYSPEEAMQSLRRVKRIAPEIKEHDGKAEDPNKTEEGKDNEVKENNGERRAEENTTGIVKDEDIKKKETEKGQNEDKSSEKSETLNEKHPDAIKEVNGSISKEVKDVPIESKESEQPTTPTTVLKEVSGNKNEKQVTPPYEERQTEENKPQLSETKISDRTTPTSSTKEESIEKIGKQVTPQYEQIPTEENDSELSTELEDSSGNTSFKHILQREEVNKQFFDEAFMSLDEPLNLKHTDQVIQEEEMKKAVLNQSFILSAVLVYITLCALFLYIRSFRKRRYTRIPLIPTNGEV